jgi:hypothetical protein
MKHVAEDGHGDTAGIGISRDERIERFQARIQGHIGVGKGYLA